MSFSEYENEGMPIFGTLKKKVINYWGKNCEIFFSRKLPVVHGNLRKKVSAENKLRKNKILKNLHCNP
jgi:hypothetical protein